MDQVWEHLKDMLSSPSDKNNLDIFRQFADGILEFCQDKSPNEVDLCACVSATMYKL